MSESCQFCHNSFDNSHCDICNGTPTFYYDGYCFHLPHYLVDIFFDHDRPSVIVSSHGENVCEIEDCPEDITPANVDEFLARILALAAFQ